MHGLWKTTVIKWNMEGHFGNKNLKQSNFLQQNFTPGPFKIFHTQSVTVEY